MPKREYDESRRGLLPVDPQDAILLSLVVHYKHNYYALHNIVCLLVCARRHSPACQTSPTV